MDGNQKLILISILTWVFLSLSLDLQHVPHRKNNEQFLKFFIYPQFLLMLSVFFWIIFLEINNISKLHLLIFFLVQFFLLLLVRLSRQKIMRKLRGNSRNFRE